MINWLTDYIGTGAFDKVIATNCEYPVLDVRGLVDKSGNSIEFITEKITQGLSILDSVPKIVVCCDYGMSRSNSIAAGIIAKKEDKPLSQVVELYFKNIAEGGVKLDMFNTIFQASVGHKDTSLKNTILVTGASGFLGKSLQKKLITEYKVIGVNSEKYNLLTNPLSLDIFVKENNISTIIHLANPRIYTLNIALGDSLVMLKNVLELCRINDIKLIYISSWEVYSGYNTEKILADESLPLFPRGSYGESKWLSEQLITQYSKMYGLKYNIIRSSPIYGLDSDKPKFIYNFLNKAKKNETITTHKYVNGFPNVDLLHQEDIVDAIEKTININGNNVFNIGSGISLNTNEVAKFIVESLGSKSNIEINHIEDFYPNIQMNYSKINSLVGWHPQNNFKDFITNLI